VKAGFIVENGRTQVPEGFLGHRRRPAPVPDKAPEFALPRAELARNCSLEPPPSGEDHEIKR